MDRLTAFVSRMLAVAIAALVFTGPGMAGEKDADLTRLIAKINQYLKQGWDRAKAPPAPVADDAEFLRRVTLDLAGRIPTVAEARAFLRSIDPDKRQKLVGKLLRSHRYVTHFTNVWESWLIPEAGSSFQARFIAPPFTQWLRARIRKNQPYDKMVYELLSTPFRNQPNRAGFLGPGAPGGSPLPYYQLKESKPENLAAATSRLFLGVKLECAQCHDHPFATWSREEFWSYTAFFAGLRSSNRNNPVLGAPQVGKKHEITIPGTKKVVQATFLDGSRPKWDKKVSGGETLAKWLTAKSNPYFAKAMVNRFWEYFHGTGLIEPIDEMVGSDNAPSHPGILEELAAAWVEKDFDLHFLIKAITGAKAYHLSSRRTAEAQEDLSLFAMMPVRGLTGEQLFDSIATATGYQSNSPAPSPLVVANDNSLRQQFLNRFGNQTGKKSEVQTSILQALAMMNGKLTGDATSLTRSETLVGILDSPFMDTQGRIETLFLSAYSRKPTEKELRKLSGFVSKRQAEAADKKKAYNEALADVFWVLLNSSEFMFNH